MLSNFRNVDSLLLEVWLPCSFPARVKLRRTCAVAVSAPYLGFLPSDVALLSHSFEYLSGRIVT